MQVDRYDDSTLSKMQRQYWEAKQIFLKNVKKKEDECIVSADADLDAKLEVRILFSLRMLCHLILNYLISYSIRSKRLVLIFFGLLKDFKIDCGSWLMKSHHSGDF